jgi:hypothetical protein
MGGMNGRTKDFKKGLKRKIPYCETSGKTKNQMGGCGSERCSTSAEDERMEYEAANRDEWRRIMREVKARKGL